MIRYSPSCAKKKLNFVVQCYLKFSAFAYPFII